MTLSEFGLIERFFSRIGAARSDVTLGVGDDAALVDIGGESLALAVDTLIEDVHFPADAPPASIGHKLLTVNLSDMAAMGAEPAWALLALTLPGVDEGWLAALRDGMHGISARHGLALIGGDTTRGRCVTASVFIAGRVDGALRRDGASPGDELWISGAPGEAGAGLACWQSGRREGAAAAQLIHRLHWPEPRVALGRALRGIASAAVDVSDGLVADAGHLGGRSGVDVAVSAARLPLSPAALAVVGEAAARDYALTGGDDYELLFTAAPAAAARVRAAAADAGTPVTFIGRVHAGDGQVRVAGADGRVLPARSAGYRHFDGNDE